MENLDVTSYRKENFLNRFIRQWTGAASSAIGAAAGTQIAGAAGSMAGSAGAIGGAVAGSASSAANFALSQAGKAVENMSIIMIVLGIIQFVMRSYVGDKSPLVFILSLLLFVMAGYAMAEKVRVARWAVFGPMIVFSVWYFYFKANIVPGFLIYFLSIAVGLLLVIDILTKGRAVQPELYGLFPVLFFFLDMGLIPFLIDTIGLPLTNLAQNLVLFMPWWAFFGIMTFPIDGSNKDSKVNGLMQFLHIIGVFYIIFVFLLPMIPSLGYDTNSFVPDVGTLASTQEEYRERLEGTRNPVSIFWECAFVEYRYDELDTCEEEKKQEAEIEAECRNQGFSESSPQEKVRFEKCVEDTKRAQEEWEVAAQGSVSRELDKHIAIELEKGSTFDKDISLLARNTANLQYPVKLRIENPHEKEFTAVVGCSFENRNSRKASVNGTVSHATLGEDGVLEVSDGLEQDFLCTPNEVLNGTYQLEFSVFLPEMETTSYLKRVVVEEYDYDSPFKNADVNELIDPFFSTGGANGRAYYPEEFVALNFGISDQKVLELDSYPLLVSSIENIGEGSINEILWYDIDIGGFEPDSEMYNCFSGDSYSVYVEEDNRKGYSEPLGSCYLIMDSEVQDAVDRFDVSFHEFEAHVGYSYTLKESYNVEVDLR